MPDIVLYQFPAAFELTSLGPFCTKLEAYFRAAKIVYSSELASPREAPRGKVPYVRWDGELIGDSHRIIRTMQDEPR